MWSHVRMHFKLDIHGICSAPLTKNFLDWWLKERSVEKKIGRRKHLFLYFFFILCGFGQKIGAGICRRRCHMAHEKTRCHNCHILLAWHPGPSPPPETSDSHDTADTWNGRRKNMEKTVSSLNKQPQVPAHEWDSHLNQAKMRSQHDSKWFKSQVLSCRPTSIQLRCVRRNNNEIPRSDEYSRLTHQNQRSHTDEWSIALLTHPNVFEEKTPAFCKP